MAQKRQWKMLNSSAIATGENWFPFSESTAPSDNEIENFFPLKTLMIENLSGESYNIILDPAPLNSTKEYRVGNGAVLRIEPEDNITFYQVKLVNNGALETAINELKITVRNY